jgi:hypothetical protein
MNIFTLPSKAQERCKRSERILRLARDGSRASAPSLIHDAHQRNSLNSIMDHCPKWWGRSCCNGFFSHCLVLFDLLQIGIDPEMPPLSIKGLRLGIIL